MCEVQMLRSLVTQRLTTAAEEILGLFERTIEEYEEECSCSKEHRQRVHAIYGSAQAPKMSRVQMLRELVNRRLTAAVEETFMLIKKNIVGYEEEIDRQRGMVEDSVKPEIQINEADSPQLFVFKMELDQQDPHPLHIKEEQEELWTTQEGEQLQGQEEADINKFPFTPIPVKSENDEEKPQSPQHSLTQTEESREAEPLSSTSTEQMKTEGDGEDCGVSEPSEPTSNLTPASDVQPTSDGQFSSDCSETEDSDDDWKETSEPQSCLDTLENKQSHVSHKRSHTGEKTFSCTVCGKGFGYKGSLQRHMILHTGEKPFSCSICGKQFSSSGAVSQHKVIHTRNRPFSCTVCGERFGDEGRLGRHMRFHPGEKAFSCSVCGKAFHQKGNMQEHMRSHTGDSPFICSVCGKGFGYKGNLQRHMTSHTGGKPFDCTVCGKKFGSKQQLQRHMILHTGEKPFSCSICGKQFSSSGAVSQHKVIHTGDRPFSCSVCNKSFSRKWTLDMHTRTHTGEKPYACTFCSKSFSRRSTLVLHMTLHPIETI